MKCLPVLLAVLVFCTAGPACLGDDNASDLRQITVTLTNERDTPVSVSRWFPDNHEDTLTDLDPGETYKLELDEFDDTTVFFARGADRLKIAAWRCYTWDDLQEVRGRVVFGSMNVTGPGQCLPDVD